ncbi:uncharacterized protein cubi_01138 [Cryptosporidium ubiquitum]|uniref:Uncharacterized protein n=1 Tax=Cryptosporidium ubiquitum TaxID=857276 RepID=A0A1J4MJB5_9CRYT|nr:uncharacterized protein cubi_01138 [Cryptosporidium ubiquitum]OII74294.1 hypothetical protein cubi_01138 [Cryptosporidium ubiquitum]
METFIKTAVLILFFIAINLDSGHEQFLELVSNHEYSFIRSRQNAWDIANENNEIFNSPRKRVNEEMNFSDYKWNINYDQPFSSQISQIILVVLAIVILICVILSLICCFYSVPKEEDFTKKNGIYYFENEKRPEEFVPIYQKNAQSRRYILTGEIPKNIEYED